MCSTLTLGARHHYGNLDTQMLAIKCKNLPRVIPLNYFKNHPSHIFGVVQSFLLSSV